MPPRRDIPVGPVDAVLLAYESFGAAAAEDAVALLQDARDSVHTVAAYAFGRLEASWAAAPVAALLKDRDCSAATRAAAAVALGNLGTGTALHVQVLAGALQDECSHVRHVAAQALERIARCSGDTTKDIVAVDVAALLLDERDHVRAVAADLLSGRVSETLTSCPTFSRGAGATAVALRVSQLVEGSRNAGSITVELAADESVNATGDVSQEATPSDATIKCPEHARVAGAEVLGALGEDTAVTTAPVLARLLQDESYLVRKSAIVSLGLLGEAVVPAVVALFHDERDFVFVAAAEVLSNFGAAAGTHVAPLLSDGKVHTRRAAAEVLGLLGEHAVQYVQDLEKLLSDSSRFVRRAASEAILCITTDPEPLSEDIQALRAKTASQLEQEWDELRALVAASSLDSEERSSGRDSASDLKMESWMGRAVAVKTLSDMGEAARPHCGSLVIALKDENRFYVRRTAMEALQNFGEEAAKQVAVLLTDERDHVRSAVVEVLQNIGGEAAVTHTVKLLDDEREHARVAGAELLGNLLAPLRESLKSLTWAHETIVALVARLKDRSPYVRRAASSALRSIGGDTVAAEVTELLASRKITAVGIEPLLLEELARNAAVEVLQALGGCAAARAAALLQDERALVRVAAINVLGGVGVDAEKHAAELAALIRDESGMVRRAAADTLVYLGPAAAAHATDALRDSRECVRMAAARAIAGFRDSAAPCVADLLKDTHGFQRAAAIEAFRNFSAEGARPAEALLEDEQETVRAAAAEALARVGASAANHAGRLRASLRDDCVLGATSRTQ